MNSIILILSLFVSATAASNLRGLQNFFDVCTLIEPQFDVEVSCETTGNIFQSNLNWTITTVEPVCALKGPLETCASSISIEGAMDGFETASNTICANSLEVPKLGDIGDICMTTDFTDGEISSCEAAINGTPCNSCSICDKASGYLALDCANINEMFVSPCAKMPVVKSMRGRKKSLGGGIPLFQG